MNEQTKHDEIELLEKLFEFIIPKYNEAHDIMTSMLDFEPTQEIRLADLGCGFGDLTKRIIDAFPLSVVFGIDNQSLILERAREKHRESLDQIVLYERDLNNTAWMNDVSHLNAVVSSFALDYLSEARHQEILKESFDILEPSGRWISCEFFRSEDNRVNRVFHDLEMAFIQNALQHGEVSEAQIDQLGTSSILRQEHHIVTVDEKVAWLKAAGFKNVDVPWRFLNLAIVSGVK
jgi:ubiquinone/menaquinone biosynthesis C-methylase UbiE